MDRHRRQRTRRSRRQARQAERKQARQAEALNRLMGLKAIGLLCGWERRDPVGFLEHALKQVGMTAEIQQAIFTAQELNLAQAPTGKFALITLRFEVNGNDLHLAISTELTELSLIAQMATGLDDDQYRATLENSMAVAKHPFFVLADFVLEGEVVRRTISCLSAHSRPETGSVNLTQALKDAGISYGTFRVLQSRGQAIIPVKVPGERGYRVDTFQMAALRIQADRYRETAPLKTHTRPPDASGAMTQIPAGP